MIDFHSHILPGVDDGAKDVETSLEMLSISKDGGVDTVLLTPHCHPRSQEHIDAFLEKRDNAFKTLSSAINENLPGILPASEVRIYQDFHKYKRLEELCIQGTNYILLEMPYELWKDYAFEEIYQLTRLGFKPIMAHLDRFLDQEKHFREIFSLGSLVQMNTSAFLEPATRKKMVKFFEKGHIHVIGSDTHDLYERKPDMKDAYDVILRKFGTEYIDYIDYAGENILQNKDIRPSIFQKMNPIKKLFI
ncbi:MAG: hypothetical protein IKY39_01630 [Clostridia bacterium]|nr:hypothetical protein [Clostridia bacterium]